MSQFSNLTDYNISCFCFVCDRELNKFQLDIKCNSSKSNDQIYQRFRSIVSRYLNINLPEASKTLGVANPSSPQWDKLECCESCFEIVKKVCEIYEQWKNLQLELNWNLNKIGELMQRSGKCDRNLIHNQTERGNFKQDFKINVESMNRNEYPHLILEKVTISPDDKQQQQNQSVSVKLENDDNEESSLHDQNNDLGDMDTMDFQINNHIDMSCVIKPELTVKVKPEIRKKVAGKKEKKKNSAVTENGEKNFKKFACSICNKRFRSTGMLNRHARIHTGEKPFQCRHCEQCFTRKDTRTTHEMTHNAESIISKFNCRFCSKKFSSNQTKITHEWSHTGLKPFQCSVCEQRFTAVCSTKRHIALLHKNVEDAKVVKKFNSYKEFE